MGGLETDIFIEINIWIYGRTGDGHFIEIIFIVIFISYLVL